MMMMHYDKYDGLYGYDLIRIRIYHPFLWGSRAPFSLLLQLYWWWLWQRQWCQFIVWWDDNVASNDDYACGITFAS